MRRPFVVAMLIIVVVFDILFRVLKVNAPEYHIAALQISNYMMATLCIVAYLLVSKQKSDRPQAFVRGVYSATFLKLFICMVAILAYLLLNRGSIHKPTVYMLFGVYVVYSIVETAMLSRSVKEKN